MNSINARLASFVFATLICCNARAVESFDHGQGNLSVHPLPFGDAVARVVIDLETPSGALIGFETLVTLGSVSVTAFGPDGFVNLSQHCGNLVRQGGTGTLEALDFYRPELASWAGKRNGNLVAGIRSACASCAGGDAVSCRSCAESTVSAFLAPRSCDSSGLMPQGGGSDNGNNDSGDTGSGGSGQSLSPIGASCAYSTLGGGSDNGNHDGGTGGESVQTIFDAGACSADLLGGGSDNGNHDGGGTGSD